ncbi:MAG: DinB family protein [Bacteroidota bacterium]
MWQDKGFLQERETDVQDAMKQLGKLIPELRKKYESLAIDELLQHPAPGKWSRQQVLGHLIDSAINNLKRFTDAQLLDQPYTIISYKQDGLMEVNSYQELPLDHLLNLWQALNRQIIFVVDRIPADKLSYEVQPQYNQTGTQTLAWLICDYVAHMKHHLHAMNF